MTIRERFLPLEKNPTTGQVVELFGPTAEFLTSPQDERNDFCVIKGTIPPGAFVPLHTHADTEGFFILSGTLEGLRFDGEDHHWIPAKAGNYVHIPSGAKHAWRNVSRELAVSLILTTNKIGQFFLEVGRLADGQPQSPPTPEELARFATISARYGYWNATPEENAAVGIRMSF